MSEISAGLLRDALGLLGIPSETLASVYKEVQEQRKRDALEILLSEIRQGVFKNIDKSETVAIVERYLRDAMEGAARNNLKLMAQVINGMAIKNALMAPDFRRYAAILSTLTNDEIQLLGTIAAEGHEDYESAKRALIKLFPEDKCRQILQALLRTGLVAFIQSIESQYRERMPDSERDHSSDKIRWIENDFWTNYEFTDLMREILKYTQFPLDCRQTGP